MSITAGELFVNLGVKGSDKTIGALTGIKKGLGETASMSLEAKAAIVGAMYALERLFAASGAAGTNLTNFNALTGLSTKQLQQWQYAARQAGISNEEFTGSLKAVQTGMTNMLLGKGAPEGMALLANKVGFDPKRARDTFYVMEQLQKFAKTAPADVGNSVLKSFGVSEGTIAGMRRGVFNQQAFAKAPSYSDKEIGALDKANVAWSNLGNKIEMAFGHFNAKHGGALVNDISKIVTQVIKLAEALQHVAEKLKLFTIFEKSLGAVAGFLETTATLFGGSEKDRSKKASEISKKVNSGETRSFLEKLGLNLKGGNPFLANMSEKQPIQPDITPSVKAPSQQANTQNVNINQNLNFQHEGKDHKRTADSVKKANQDALRQYNQGHIS